MFELFCESVSCSLTHRLKGEVTYSRICGGEKCEMAERNSGIVIRGRRGVATRTGTYTLQLIVIISWNYG